MPRCGTFARSSRFGLAVPRSKPRYTCRESALMITISRRSDSHMAIADFPDAVGPQITAMRSRSTSSESALELIPRKLHDGGPAVDVVRGQRAVAERHEERAHLLRREQVAGLDRGFARDGCGELLVSRGARGRAIARQRRQRVAQTPLGVEARMRRGHGVHDHALPPELAELIAEPLQRVAMLIERLSLCGCELYREREQQSLRRAGSALERGDELFVQHALVRRMLVDEHDALIDFEHQVRAAELNELRHIVR